MHKQKLKFDLTKNSLVFGDCKEWLEFIPNNLIDMIYIDPPWFSKGERVLIWGNGHEKRCYEDRWKDGIEHHIGWLRDRLLVTKKIMKKTGSVAIHCNWNASHKIRCLMDELYGENNFVNEIIWYHYHKYSSGKKCLPRAHSNIFLYKMFEESKFFPLREKREGKIIILKPVHEIIGELVLTKEQRTMYQKLYNKRIKEVKQQVAFINKEAS